MKKYTITKSITRKERCNLVYKLYSEMMSNNHFLMIFSTLEQELARKQKMRLYGNRKDNKLNVVKLVRFKGILVYNIITKNKGIDIVFDASPIDAPYVEFIRIAPSGTPIVYSQHLLDRYNERICNDRFTNHKDIMKELFVRNPNKANMAISDNNQIVQRIDDGFVLGKLDKRNSYIVLNTFYESEEYRDNEIKNSARKAKLFHDNLTTEQQNEYNSLLFLRQRVGLSFDSFIRGIKGKGFF
ncbi:hypothetical protein E1J38_002300 [Seonamhaeicola sediminis]|uniref:Uncharacterized protein n=1 Tax=Seonamhaeicola sediminis TaxID=2528206 RepID=A0A562YI10_9FLAO|nr:hypothetical protein [Seonamhaeicola sediminis]TWO34710.1 hypothetical protein E1J38_002300 [Seonamhaeicola sediminis]